MKECELSSRSENRTLQDTESKASWDVGFRIWDFGFCLCLGLNLIERL